VRGGDRHKFAQGEHKEGNIKIYNTKVKIGSVVEEQEKMHQPFQRRIHSSVITGTRAVWIVRKADRTSQAPLCKMFSGKVG
jgi:hypothetical protein